MKARQISDTQSHKLEKHIKVLQSHKLWDHGHICQISKFVYVCLCFLFTQIQIREFGKYWLQPPFKDALTKMILGTYTPILVVLLICGNNVRVESLVVCKSPGSACRLVTGWPHSVDTGQWQDCAALRTHSAHSRASTSPSPAQLWHRRDTDPELGWRCLNTVSCLPIWNWDTCPKIHTKGRFGWQRYGKTSVPILGEKTMFECQLIIWYLNRFLS